MGPLARTSLSVCVSASVAVTRRYVAKRRTRRAQRRVKTTSSCAPTSALGTAAALWVPRGGADASTCGAAGRVPVGRKWAISTVLALAFYSTSVHITEGRPLTN